MSDTDDRSATRRGFLTGATGAAAVAATAPAAAQEDGGGNETAGGGGGETHEVAMEGTSFSPAELTVAPGDTVVWTTTGTAPHSVTAYEDEIPGEAAYFASGGFDSQDAAESGYPDEGAVAEGESYEHTFDVVGSYGYFCIPHETSDMVGTIEVVEGGASDGGGFQSALTDSFKTLGVATVGAMVSVLVLAYFFLKYGGLEDTTQARE